jgi:pyrimidine operon attenuation protein/uracil phosphoribosyltransferase
VERTRGVDDLALVGIRTRGAYIAERIAHIIEREEGQRPQVGILDITLYRDDFSTVSEKPIVHSTEIQFDVNDKVLVLVDDVLYTGRTVRAALDAIVDFGRPKRVELAVLIDRCHRELPIRADYAGKELSIKYEDLVLVKIKEVDGVDEVLIEERNEVG